MKTSSWVPFVNIVKNKYKLQLFGRNQIFNAGCLCTNVLNDAPVYKKNNIICRYRSARFHKYQREEHFRVLILRNYPPKNVENSKAQIERQWKSDLLNLNLNRTFTRLWKSLCLSYVIQYFSDNFRAQCKDELRITTILFVCS